jgi:hypothetical protein
MNDDEKYIEEFVKGIPFEDASSAHREALRVRLLHAFPGSGPAPTNCLLPIGRALIRRPRARLAAAAVVVLFLGALIGRLGLMLAGGSVAWADVTARFRSVSFFSATIYVKQNATAEPTQMELWMGQNLHVRLRVGRNMVFAYQGQVRAYDMESRQAVEPDGATWAFIEKIGRAREFSLEAIVEVMFGGRTMEVTPLINPDAVISQDVVVFDVAVPHTPEWVRIWALRASRLPVRITVWDPRDGRSTDAVFTYSHDQTPEFFDPNAFAALLQSRAGGRQVDVAYAFLKDPGGREITREETSRDVGYLTPEREPVGVKPAETPGRAGGRAH